MKSIDDGMALKEGLDKHVVVVVGIGVVETKETMMVAVRYYVHVVFASVVVYVVMKNNCCFCCQCSFCNPVVNAAIVTVHSLVVVVIVAALETKRCVGYYS